MSLSKENRGFKNYKEMKEGEEELREAEMSEETEKVGEAIALIKKLTQSFQKTFNSLTTSFQEVMNQRNKAVELLKAHKYTTNCKCGTNMSISVGDHKVVPIPRDPDCLNCNTKDFLKLFEKNDEEKDDSSL